MQRIDVEYSEATKAAQVQFAINLLTDPLNLFIRNNFPSESASMDFAECCEYMIKNVNIDDRNKKNFEMALLQRHRVAHQDRKFFLKWNSPTYSFKLLATYIDQQKLKTSIDRFVSYSNTFKTSRSTDFPIPIEFSKEHLSYIEAAQIQFAIQLLTSALNSFIRQSTWLVLRNMFNDMDFAECCDYILKNRGTELQDSDKRTFRSALILRQIVAHQQRSFLRYYSDCTNIEHFKSIALLIGRRDLKTSIDHFVSKFKTSCTSIRYPFVIPVHPIYSPESAIAHGPPDNGSVKLKFAFLAFLIFLALSFFSSLPRV